jgi:hypothetical protein
MSIPNLTSQIRETLLSDFNERKIVKTISFKKVSAVAVASLGFGLLSVVPANAANEVNTAKVTTATTVDVDGNSLGSYTAQALTAISSSNAPGVSFTPGILADTFSQLTVPAGARIVFTITQTGGVGTPVFSASDRVTFSLNGVLISSTVGAAAASTTVTYDVPTTASGAYAGVLTALVTPATVATAAVIPMNFTLNVTSAAATVAALSAANSNISVMLQSDHATCAAGTSAVHKTAVAAVAKTSGYYTSGDASSAFTICVSTRNGLDAAVTPTSLFISTSKGFVKDANDATVGTAPGVATTPGAGVTKTNLSGDSVQTGATTITAVATYSTSVITLSTSFTWYGELSSLELANNAFASSTAAANTADAITVIAKDKDGNKIPHSAWTDGAAAGKVRTGIGADANELQLVSSKGTGATVTTKGQSNAYATVAFAGADATALQTSNGSIDVDCAATRSESIAITLFGYSSVSAAAGAVDPVTIKSNTVNFVCSSATPATVVVTPSATSVAAGKSITVDIKVTDADGLIVPDGTAVALAANGGHSVIGASTTTTNGGLLTKGTFVAGGSGGTASITAVSGAASGVGTVSVTGSTGSSIETSIASLNAKIVALNALIAKIMKRLNIR